MPRKLISILVTACLVVGLFTGIPMKASAEEKVVYIAGVALNSTTPYYHNGASGAVGTADANSEGANAVLDVTSDTLTLNGLNINAPVTNGISTSYFSQLAIILTGVNTITSTHNNLGIYGIRAYADITMSGNGSLTILIDGTGTSTVANLFYGIEVNSLTMNGGELCAEARGTNADISTGIATNDGTGNISLTINSGTVTGVGKTRGISAWTGGMAINGGTVTATASVTGYGLHVNEADAPFTIANAHVTAKGTNGGLNRVPTSLTGYALVSSAIDGADPALYKLGDSLSGSLYFEAKQPVTYTVTLDKNGGTADGSATANYGGSLTGITNATNGYVLDGYYTAATDGDKIVNADGSLVANVTGYTEPNGLWSRSSDCILYAHWTSEPVTPPAPPTPSTPSNPEPEPTPTPATPQPTVTQPVVPVTEYTYYTVQKGDSLWKIAKRHNIPLAVLALINPDIVDFRKIYPGQQIIIDYITDLRMEHASSMIKEGNGTLKSIAVECGYRDYFYFNKVFKGHFGVAPSQYLD